MNDFAIAEGYRDLEPENAGLRSKEVHSKSFAEAANILWQKISNIREMVMPLDEASWKANFVKSCSEKRAELKASWKANWRQNASGKQLINDLYRV